MSQVKNLRAMFEHRGPSSPPERGREGTPSQADSPRPLSRVRTNFVTVEKDGRVGLQRDPSSDSIPTLSRTMSAGTEGDVPTPTTSQAGVPEVKVTPDDARPLAAAQTPKRVTSAIPEEAAPVTPTKVATPLVAIAKLAAANAAPKTSVPALLAVAPSDVKLSVPTVAVAGEEPAASQEQKENKTANAAAATAERSPVRKLFVQHPSKPGETEKTAPSALKNSADAPTNGASKLRSANLQNGQNGDTNGASKAKTDAPKAALSTSTASSIPMRSKIPSAPKEHKESKEPSKTVTKATTGGKSLPKAISTAKTATKTANNKTSVPKVKTPTSPSKPSVPKAAAAKTTSDRKTSTPAVAEKKATPATSAPKGAAAAAAAGKKPPSIQTFPPNGLGFVKPKPKSPTRPVQLPSSLTTHTASSATKTRQSLSRQSGNFLAVHGASQASATRPLSRASASSTVGTAATTSTKIKPLRRQASTVGRQRPSIGPPPKQPARDHPITKKEKAVDEGFLERMMRPTQSFACKTADKVHQSPPRSNKSRESFGSNRSTASSHKPVKEKAAPKAVAVSSDEAKAASSATTAPAVAEPAEDVAAAPLPAEKEEPEAAVEEEAEKADVAPSSPAEHAESSESAEPDEAAAVEEAEDVAEEAAEATADAAPVEASEEAASEAPADEEVAEKEAAEEKDAEDELPGEADAEDKVDGEAGQEKVGEERGGEEEAAQGDDAEEEATPVPEAAGEETAEEEATREATPEVSVEAAVDVDAAHTDVAEIAASDAAAEEEAAHTEVPAVATEL